MKLYNVPVGTLGTNCYIIAAESGSCIVIDPGAQAEKLIKFIRDNKLVAKKILLTHGHHDHIGALKAFLESDESLEAYIGERDLEMLTDPKQSYSTLCMPEAPAYVGPRMQTLADGDEITLDELSIKVVTTPGHTHGCACYIIDDIIFAGDTLFLDDIGRCDLYNSDYPAMKRSLLKLCALPGNYTVYPGHGASTTLDHERRNNMYIAEARAELE